MAVDVVTYLRSGDLQAVWDRFDTLPPCAAKLLDIDLKWIELFRSVGRRDAPGMSSIAEDLLKQDVRYEEINYLVPVAMLGNRVEGNGVRALQLWSRYRKNNYSADWVMLLEVLAAGGSPD